MDFLKKIFLCRSAPVSIMMIGLDAVGKTSILYKMKLGVCVNTIPTIGFNLETINIRNKSFSLIDVGGGDKIRPLWRHYKQSNAIIFVVDSTDNKRFSESAYEINSLLSDHIYSNTYLLVYANKQDLPNAVQISELIEELKLYNWPAGYWHIQPCSALEGTGLFEGLEWLYNFAENTV